MPVSGTINVKSVIPKRRQELLKWNGWGYKDSEFVIKDDQVRFTGKRYAIGELNLPHLIGWVRDTLNADLTVKREAQAPPSNSDYPSRITNDQLEALRMVGVAYSVDVMDRVFRAHGQTLHDVMTLNYARFERVPDIVVWPKCHDDCVKLIELAQRYNLALIPFGGGTAVSGAIECPSEEPRPIISLDTSQMNRILWLDAQNLTACFESGIIGQDLERELSKLGYTTGHEPDSYEFSSLGGWVATRASGMKKNRYGNIEDLLVHVKMATPRGVLEKNCQVPRMSCGPDFNHVILGSEGTLGVITEVVLKIRPLPPVKRFGSIVFPDFASGVRCMREVARQRCQPASIRLMDNGQFKFGLILKPEAGFIERIIDALKRAYVTRWKGFDPERMCVMTLLFEGEEKEVRAHEQKVYDIASKFGGLPAGQRNGERGYMLTFVIAYLRDLALKYYMVGESFETSVPWDRALTVIENVKHRTAVECEKRKIEHFMINARITQTYDAGCVIYFYLSFNHVGIDDPVPIHEQLEAALRDEIVAAGGSISHHHGVGKLRKRWYAPTVSKVGVDLYKAAKKELDPLNIFAANNLIGYEEDTPKCKL